MKIIIPGRPIAKARPKFYRKGKGIGHYDPQETEEGQWILLAREKLRQYQASTLIEGPVLLHLTFIMPIQKNWPKYKIKRLGEGKIFWHDKKPDSSNLTKFAEDCLKWCGVWKDDSQIAYTVVMKYYGLDPRTEIEIKRLYP